MKRKPKISQAEQSKRFIEAAREAGVDERDGTLENMVRKMARATKTESFTASKEATAWQRLVDWKVKHPSVRIIKEQVINGTQLKRGSPRGTPKAEGRQFFTVHIVYEE